jgi:hypothetical protein
MKIIFLYIFIIIFLFAVSTLYPSEYIVPRKPASVDVADIDLDGDLDIVLGHDLNQGNYWGMVTILKNNVYGEYTLDDTFPTFAYETSIQVDKVNNNEYPDIIANDYNDSIPSPVFTIINDFEIYQWNYIFQFCYDYITISNYITFHSSIFDLIDIVFISHVNYLWGILYNNGTGQFSTPEYYDLDYNPSGLACGDLDGNDREDILVSGGAYLDAWLNFNNGLQYYNISDTAYVSRVKISDIDNDGDNDIIATRWGMPGAPKRLFIYSNDGNGNFQSNYSKWIFEAMAQIFISDLNNDNYPEVIYNCSYHYPNSEDEIFNTYILFNNQDGTFQDPVNYYTGICSHKSHAADLDGNGWNDIITLNYDFYNPPPDTGSIHILFNDGTGNFVEDPQVGINEECIMYNEKCKMSNYPNPFNPSNEGRNPGTTISYELPVNVENAIIEIFNIKGEKLRSLRTFPNRGLGTSSALSVTWDGTDQHHKPVASGIYLYRLKTDEGVLMSKKMLLLR